MKKYQNFSDAIEEAEQTTNKWQRLQEMCNNAPRGVRFEMKEAGMLFSNEPLKDDYINEGVFEVVLDRELYNNEPKKFMHYLEKAIKNRLDSEVFMVIAEFHRVKSIMNFIIASKVSKYVSKVSEYVSKDVTNPMELCLTEAEQVEIAESGNREAILNLLKVGVLCNNAQRIIAKTGDFEYLSRLLDIKFLCNDAQRVVLNTGELELILKLFKRQDLSSPILYSPIGRLFHCWKLTTEQQKDIVLSGNRGYILQLLEYKNLSYVVQEMIVRTKEQEYILKLLKNCSHLTEGVQGMIARLDVIDYKMLLLKRDDLFNSIRKKIVGVANRDLVLSLTK